MVSQRQIYTHFNSLLPLFWRACGRGYVKVFWIISAINHFTIIKKKNWNSFIHLGVEIWSCVISLTESSSPFSLFFVSPLFLSSSSELLSYSNFKGKLSHSKYKSSLFGSSCLCIWNNFRGCKLHPIHLIVNPKSILPFYPLTSSRFAHEERGRNLPYIWGIWWWVG